MSLCKDLNERNVNRALRANLSLKLFKLAFQVLKFLEEEIQSFEKLFEELNGTLINLSFMILIHNFTERKSVDPVANDIQPSVPSRPELKPKPILIKKGEKPKTLPKPKIPPKVAPKPNVHFRSQQSDQGGTEV